MIMIIIPQNEEEKERTYWSLMIDRKKTKTFPRKMSTWQEMENNLL